MHEVKRISGFRLNFLTDPKERAMKFAQMMQALQPLMPLVELWKQEPFFLDDASNYLNTAELLGFGLNYGELFVILSNKEIVGTVKLFEIVPERTATIDAWAIPKIRGTYAGYKIIQKAAREIIEYAFSPWTGPEGNGLGLTKLKADICAGNTAALKAARALKFRQIGLSPQDAFHKGAVYDNVKLELFNPKYFSSVVEDLPNDRTQSTENPVILAPEPVPGTGDESPASGIDDTEGNDAESITGGSEPESGDVGGPSAPVAGVSVLQRPFKPRRPKAI